MGMRKPTNMTIDVDVVKAIDREIEGTSYRSRSDAVEDVMRKWLKDRAAERRRQESAERDENQ